jgi:NitT/TauT family transport system substrate-binding protein
MVRGVSDAPTYPRPTAMKHPQLALTLVTALAVTMPACHDDTIRLGNLKFAHYGAVSYVTQLAPSCGIQVREHVFAKGLDVMQAIIAGEIDVGATAAEAAISGRAGGAPIYVVASFARGGARLVVRPDAGIHSVADLKGKRVGVTRGAIHELLLAAVLAKQGLTSSERGGQDVELVYLNYPDLNQALLAKTLDAIMQTEPQSAQAILKGFGVELLKPYDTPVGEPARTLVMTQKFYDQHRATAEKFMRCFVQSTQMFITQPQLAEQYVRGTLFKNQLSSAEFNAALANAPYDVDLTAQHIQTTIDAMVKYGVGKLAKPPLANDFVRLDLLAQAKQSLGMK